MGDHTAHNLIFGRNVLHIVLYLDNRTFQLYLNLTYSMLVMTSTNALIPSSLAETEGARGHAPELHLRVLLSKLAIKGLLTAMVRQLFLL